MGLNNTKAVWSYRSWCIDLTVALIDFQLEGCPLSLNRVCQGEYVLFNDINFDGG